MNNFASKNFKLSIEDILMVPFPREGVIAAAVFGGLGVIVAMLCKQGYYEASNVEFIAQIDNLQDQCDILEDEADDKDKDIVRLNHELTKAHEQIAALEQKMAELKDSYTACRTSAEEFVNMFREKTD